MSREQGQATIGDKPTSRRPEAIDRMFLALADERRRLAVAYLADADRGVSRDELVHEVAVRTLDPRAPEGVGLDRMGIQFHHRHLPKLSAAGLVDYDEEEAVVYPTETADRVSRWIAEF